MMLKVLSKAGQIVFVKDLRELREVSFKLQDTRAKNPVILMAFYFNFEAISWCPILLLRKTQGC